ncbi:hypothetical protein BCR33DRAFT_783382 [Rhizoclosmatium globosum]|uniref:FHA domain-containing protein n=1 Tax=Rhizoclosmatium globosum TaxID=329046 RepID=A0A1Y2CKT3_9FUNG|nr:hypothetical protein BCR33DRAFT_783382 [Rhizoclosmatium globosum]|eukprot:ORY46935.1 hypothetical protein BCR33DRAFT_783382 [Rhizoclosmatium globosum]
MHSDLPYPVAISFNKQNAMLFPHTFASIHHFENATNSTTTDGPTWGNPAVSDSQYATLGVVLGMSLEICITGIITTLIRLFQGGQVVRVQNFNIIASIISAFNVVCVVYQSVESWVYFLDETHCAYGTVIGNALSQLFNLSFDVFMLYKTFCISSGSFIQVQIPIYLILVNRFVWAAVDLAKSQGTWDSVNAVCVYNQNNTTGVGYMASDMISHLFSCLTAIVVGVMNVMGKGPSDEPVTLHSVLVDGNVLRSLIVVGIHAYAMAAYTYFQNDPYASTVASLVEVYVYARCLNAENFYVVGRMSYARPSTSGRPSLTVKSQGPTGSIIEQGKKETDVWNSSGPILVRHLETECPQAFTGNTTHQSLLPIEEIIVDTEEKTWQNIAASSNPRASKQIVNAGSTGRGNNWAHGYSDDFGAEATLEALRYTIEKQSPSPSQGILLFQSIAGGTGSGLGSRLTEELREEYPKQFLWNCCVAPFASGETALQHYNSLLSLGKVQESSDLISVFSNDVVFNVVSKQHALYKGNKTDPKISLSELNDQISASVAGVLLPTSPVIQTAKDLTHLKIRAFNAWDLITQVAPCHLVKSSGLLKGLTPAPSWDDVTSDLIRNMPPAPLSIKRSHISSRLYARNATGPEFWDRCDKFHAKIRSKLGPSIVPLPAQDLELLASSSYAINMKSTSRSLTLVSTALIQFQCSATCWTDQSRCMTAAHTCTGTTAIFNNTIKHSGP